MLIFNNRLIYTLRILVSEEYMYLVKIMVFDTDNRTINYQSSTRYEISFSLIQGLYTLRIEMNGEVLDEVVLIDKDKIFQIASNQSVSTRDIKVITPPKQYSSALLGETYGSSHEYYTYPAINCSKKDTYYLNTSNNIDSNSSLFIFLRFPSLEKFMSFKKVFSESFFCDFEIVDEVGNCLTQFRTRTGIEINEENGWVAFSAKLSNGIYYLIYRGKSQRQIPIYVFKNWHTQVFMMLGKEPLFGSLRFFLSRQREYNPNEITYKYIDILLDKLQNEDYNLDNELIERAAYGKYESPILGLVCSYIYLKSKETKSDQLFKIIIQNLQNEILKDSQESPDLGALNILASNHFPKMTFKNSIIKGIPMFRIGFETILKASVFNEKLISQNSINDFISENLCFDSPLCTFKPIPFRKGLALKTDTIKVSENLGSRKNKPLENRSIDFEKYTLNQKMLSHHKEFEVKSDRFSTSIKFLFGNTLFSFIQSMEESDLEDSWIKKSVADFIRSGEDLTINDISHFLGVSGNTVNRVLSDWEKKAKTKIRK
jgi:hypothetical protein